MCRGSEDRTLSLPGCDLGRLHGRGDSSAKAGNEFTRHSGQEGHAWKRELHDQKKPGLLH